MDKVFVVLENIGNYLLLIRISDIWTSPLSRFWYTTCSVWSKVESVGKGVVAFLLVLWLRSIYCSSTPYRTLCGTWCRWGSCPLSSCSSRRSAAISGRWAAGTSDCRWRLQRSQAAVGAGGGYRSDGDGCTEMSQSKTGVLIVFERDIHLDDMVRSGTTLDAAVSSELLKNIFFVKAPMHDGAVIIRHGRISGAVACCRLSKNVNLSRDLGMRHRAGIGMSENSDAVVVIVSEETGSISVAIGGMLKRHLKPETLAKLCVMS